MKIKLRLLFFFSFIITVAQAQITESDFLKSAHLRDSLLFQVYKQKDTATYKKLIEISPLKFCSALKIGSPTSY